MTDPLPRPADGETRAIDQACDRFEAAWKASPPGPRPLLEDFLPPQVDNTGDIPAGQMILSGSGSVSQAVALWNQVLKEWRTEQPGQFQQYKAWAANGS